MVANEEFRQVGEDEDRMLRLALRKYLEQARWSDDVKYEELGTVAWFEFQEQLVHRLDAVAT